ncbi:hypothetical protein [Roseovarius sp. EL26]|uniref:hypothetical protein n=1 Tax=Roseovarius sp. EL26 TaxID=2126672 RepID=UPI000EA22A10|nr:hypothetical protein [Roseovarius sp. EL26]
MDIAKEIYRGGFYSLGQHHEKKQHPVTGVEHVIPEPDVDLRSLMQEMVPPSPEVDVEYDKYDIRAKLITLQKQFVDQSKLLLLHAVLIAILRKRDPHEHAVVLFQRLWNEHGEFLAKKLNIRWKISASTTFADHGVNFEQRSLGMGLSILFDSIKMHDCERRRSGQSGDQPFNLNKQVTRPSLAFDMGDYSFSKGDIDRNMLARLWVLAERDIVIFPLARAMLFEIMTDDRSIFARLQKLKPQKDTDGILSLLDRL